jgi:exoribonuclease-2
VENEELFAIMGDFDSTYNAYAEFQKTMECYWCLRYIQQESITLTPATVLRDDLVRLDRLPLTARIPGMPPLPAGTVVEVELSNVDLVELHFSCRFKRTLETDESTTPETV